ncbi:hypothetical protein GCM10025734_18220 [Kitasatospora paranensis]
MSSCACPPNPARTHPSCVGARSISNPAPPRRRSPTSATASSAGTGWSSPSAPATRSPKALSLERYAAAEHLTVSRRGRLRDRIDDALATRGHERRVVAAGPTAAFALQLACATDLVVTLPDAVTRAARQRLGLVALTLPLQMPDVPLYLLWHQRYDDDRAHTWLRETAAETVRTLFAPPAADR